eukprot:m.795685 g.795685  ORF g.795685 m.795685 type:complete len:75 (+) comp23341_c0_seq58:4793-5017(+)
MDHLLTVTAEKLLARQNSRSIALEGIGIPSKSQQQVSQAQCSLTSRSSGELSKSLAPISRVRLFSSIPMGLTRI